MGRSEKRDGSLENHEGFGALHPQFWRTRTATGN